MTSNLNLSLVQTTKEFLRLVLAQLQMDKLETAVALEETAAEIRAKKAAE